LPVVFNIVLGSDIRNTHVEAEFAGYRFLDDFSGIPFNERVRLNGFTNPDGIESLSPGLRLAAP